MKKKSISILGLMFLVLLMGISLACEISIGGGSASKVENPSPEPNVATDSSNQEAGNVPAPAKANSQVQGDDQQGSCYWQLVDSKEYLSGEDDADKSTTRNGNSLSTSFISQGNESCNPTDFQTTHEWTDLGSYLTPGEILTITVKATWYLDGVRECNTMSTGVKTSFTTSVSTIIARQSHIVVSTEPSGSVSSSGEWVVPAGSAEGATLSLNGHGEQGGVGGTVYYHYVYTCGSMASSGPQSTPTDEKTGICVPKIYNINNLKPGDILSPAVDFFDDHGQPVNVIGYAWFINGVERSSTVWDGNETTIELQYTCLDHSGHSETTILPAANSSTNLPAQAPDQGKNSEIAAKSPEKEVKMPNTVNIAILAVGLAGAGISGGALLTNIIKNGKETLPKDESPKKHEDTELDKPQSKSQKQSKEEKGKRKDLLDSEKEAIEKYQKNLQDLSGKVDTAIKIVDKLHTISPEGRKKIIDKMKSFKKSLDNVSETAGNLTDNLGKLQNIRDEIRNMGEKYKQLQDAHTQALKDLEELPAGAANQLADLTTAIEGFGTIADETLSRIPIVNKVYSDKLFDTTKSFKEFSKGLRKNLSRTVFRTSIEAKQELTKQERIDFGEKPDYRDDPEVQEILRKRAREQAKQPQNSILKKISDFMFGKEVPPDVQKFR